MALKVFLPEIGFHIILVAWIYGGNESVQKMWLQPTRMIKRNKVAARPGRPIPIRNQKFIELCLNINSSKITLIK
ncbi:MAG: hypothetical protein COY19_01850 [Candidatus Marinimicrobia bacterium CG_4_10_14_0_2_um_filter_48_9]|nr:MAG: hypothetical protein COY19_01850 [Candidatus Marinimicrobia bacterium CG_4_10_14_0_2_um_filter_48_9]